MPARDVAQRSREVVVSEREVGRRFREVGRWFREVVVSGREVDPRRVGAERIGRGVADRRRDVVELLGGGKERGREVDV